MDKPKRLALLLPCQSTFGRGVVRGVREYCHEHGAWDFWIETTCERTAFQRLRNVLAVWPATGLIAEVWYPDQARAMREFDFPVIEVSGSWQALGLRVQADNDIVGRMAAGHFLERGLKRFAFYGVKGVLHSEQRKEAFARELRKAGFACATNEFRPRRPDVNPLGERTAVGQWLAGLDKPIGLMCDTDFRAREVIFACQQAGIRIPIDVAVVGVGNDDMTCELTGVPISSVDLAPGRIGYLAASLIDRPSRGRKPPRKCVLVEPAGLIVRRSSDILQAENERVAEAVRFIQHHAHESIRVEDVLAAIPISRRALERNFQQLLGRSPREQIFHVHVELAKRLLVDTDWPVAQVAQRSGFTSAPILSDVFLRRVGQRPGEYRRNNAS